MTCQRTALCAGTAVSILVALNASFIANHILGSPNTAPLIAVASLGLLFGSIDGCQTGVLIGAEALRELTLAVLVAALIAVPISVLMAAIWGLPGAVWGALLGTLAQCIASRVSVNGLIRDGKLPRPLAADPYQWTLLRDSCCPAMLAGLVVAPAHWLCQTLLLRQPNGAIEVASLAVAFQWFQTILFIPVNVGRIVLPVLTDSVAAAKNRTSMAVLFTGVVGNAIVITPLVAIVALGSSWIVSLYGKPFASAAPVVTVAAAAAGLVAIQSNVGHLVVATGRFWTGLTMNLAWATAYVSLSWLLLDRGAFGIALALAIAYALHASWTFAFAGVWLRSQSHRTV
jgi:O-antigen/teichoic acid export membrane protein